MSYRHIPRALCGAALLLVWAACAVQAVELIDVSVAPLYVGKDVIVEGKITAAERDANVVRLQMGPAGRGLTVALVIPLLNDFPTSPETYYAGKIIRAAGLVRSYRGKPELAVRSAQDVSIVGEPPDAAAGVAAKKDAAVLRQQVQDLENRVNELERNKDATPQP